MEMIIIIISVMELLERLPKMTIEKLNHIEVSKMMLGNKKLVLLHDNKYYLLSITRRGKLILTAYDGMAKQVKEVPSGDEGL